MRIKFTIGVSMLFTLLLISMKGELLTQDKRKDLIQIVITGISNNMYLILIAL